MFLFFSVYEDDFEDQPPVGMEGTGAPSIGGLQLTNTQTPTTNLHTPVTSSAASTSGLEFSQSQQGKGKKEHRARSASPEDIYDFTKPDFGY